jgi:hypothetical protein
MYVTSELNRAHKSEDSKRQWHLCHCFIISQVFGSWRPNGGEQHPSSEDWLRVGTCASSCGNYQSCFLHPRSIWITSYSGRSIRKAYPVKRNCERASVTISCVPRVWHGWRAMDKIRLLKAYCRLGEYHTRWYLLILNAPILHSGEWCFRSP